MKSKKILPVLLIIALLFCACKSSAAPDVERVYLRADVTHDGNKDRIVSYLSDADSGKAKVTVQHTDSDNKNVFIYQETLGTSENSQKGIYLCRYNGKFDLFVWQPTVKDDKTTLSFEIFYLDFDPDTGETKKVVEFANKISFTKEEVTKDGDKFDKASNFVFYINSIIRKGFALIDTVGGDISYTPKPQERIYKPYYPEWFDKSYKSENIKKIESNLSQDYYSSSPSATSSDDKNDKNNNVINH